MHAFLLPVLLAVFTVWVTASRSIIASPQQDAESRLAAASTERGEELFRAYCTTCHGVAADGRGPRARWLGKPPRNFTDAHWRKTATPERVARSIRNGVQGTAMPSWGALAEQDRWDLTAYVLSVADRPRLAQQTTPGAPASFESVPPTPSEEPETTATGTGGHEMHPMRGCMHGSHAALGCGGGGCLAPEPAAVAQRARGCRGASRAVSN